MHRIGAHHHPVQVEGLEQLPERGDLIGLVRHTCLGKDSARGLVQGRQEMRCRVLACAGCAHGLTVHCDDSAAGDGAGTRTEPGVSHECRDPWRPGPGAPAGGGQVGDVLPYRCQTPATGQHPRHGHRDSTVSRLWRTPRLSRGSVMFLKNLGQELARQGGRRGR